MKTGFTLIELLVVISIIAVLSTVGIVTFQGVQAKARDSVRKSDLQKLATALELYFQKNGKYIPPANTTDPDNCTRDTNSFYSNNGIKDYMSNQTIPLDPSSTAANPIRYCYISINNGQAFQLFAHLENCDGSGGNLCSSMNYNYSVVSDK